MQPRGHSCKPQRVGLLDMMCWAVASRLSPPPHQTLNDMMVSSWSSMHSDGAAAGGGTENQV